MNCVILALFAGTSVVAAFGTGRIAVDCCHNLHFLSSPAPPAMFPIYRTRASNSHGPK